MKNRPIDRWLATQPKEFVENVLDNKMFGDGHFDITKLRELDELFNPEDEND